MRGNKPIGTERTDIEQLRYESIAGLVSDMWAGFQPLAARIQDQFDGHLPLLQHAIDWAIEFENQVVAREVQWDETHDWIMCIEELARQVCSPDSPVNWNEVFEEGKVNAG